MHAVKLKHGEILLGLRQFQKSRLATVSESLLEARGRGPDCGRPPRFLGRLRALATITASSSVPRSTASAGRVRASSSVHGERRQGAEIASRRGVQRAIVAGRGGQRAIAAGRGGDWRRSRASGVAVSVAHGAAGAVVCVICARLLRLRDERAGG